MIITCTPCSNHIDSSELDHSVTLDISRLLRHMLYIVIRFYFIFPTDAKQKMKNLGDSIRTVANKNLQIERLSQDKTRLQYELDDVCKKLEVERMRLRDLDYAAQHPTQNAGHGWNFNTRISFANSICECIYTNF